MGAAKPAANRLAGDSDSEDAIAGKPVSYGSVAHAEIDGGHANPVGNRLAGDDDFTDATALHLCHECYEVFWMMRFRTPMSMSQGVS
jgi:hypothetical protein